MPQDLLFAGRISYALSHGGNLSGERLLTEPERSGFRFLSGHKFGKEFSGYDPLKLIRI
jgi:hypothetical protein